MTTPFKPAGYSVVIIDKDGISREADAFNETFATVADLATFVDDNDMGDVIRVLIIDPAKNKPYDGALTVRDVTAEVVNAWLIETDLIGYDAMLGKPAAVTIGQWDALLREERAAAREARMNQADLYGAPARL